MKKIQFKKRDNAHAYQGEAITVRLGKELTEKINSYCEKENIYKTEFVKTLVLYYLNSL